MPYVHLLMAVRFLKHLKILDRNRAATRCIHCTSNKTHAGENKRTYIFQVIPGYNYAIKLRVKMKLNSSQSVHKKVTFFCKHSLVPKKGSCCLM